MGFTRERIGRARRWTAPVLASAMVLSGMLAAAGPASAAPKATVNVQLLAINDFHGALPDPTTDPTKPKPGGIEYLATYIRQRQAQNPNTLLLSGGDLIGASPLVSALFHDEPTIEAMNLLHMNYAVVGNHEFDEGLTELFRMQYGGCNQVDGCQSGHPFAGASFQYLAANVIGPNGKTIFPPYAIKTTGGVKIGLIGVVTKSTPSIVSSSGVYGLTFLDETSTVNKYAAQLKKQGVRTIVVLLHEGNDVGGATINDCPTLSSSFSKMVKGMAGAVRVVISGHSHQAYNCKVGSKIVTSASSAGKVLTDIHLTISKASDTVVTSSATNISVDPTVAKDPAETALLTTYTALSAPLANRVVGTLNSALTRTGSAAGESTLGDVIADSQLEATKGAGSGDAKIAFMNPGGIRTDLQAGTVTYGQTFAVQPFGNVLQTLTLKGSDIKAALEQQWCQPNAASDKILQVSTGFTYSWSAGAACGSKVSAMQLSGLPIDMAATYRVTVNNFLAGGGDNFVAFKSGTDITGGGVDLDAFTAYLGAHSPLDPPALNRITKLP